MHISIHYKQRWSLESSTLTHYCPHYDIVNSSPLVLHIRINEVGQLSSAQPLSKPMLGYCQLDQTLVKFQSKYKYFHCENASKILSEKWWSFCPEGDSKWVHTIINQFIQNCSGVILTIITEFNIRATHLVTLHSAALMTKSLVIYAIQRILHWKEFKNSKG